MCTPAKLIQALPAVGVALALLLPPGSSVEAQDDPSPLRIVALNLTAQEEERSAEEGTGSPVSKPGDVIEYRISFTNHTGGSLRDVVFDDPIPAGLVYVEASAGAERSDVMVDFSIDGGASYSPAPEVDVQEGGGWVTKPAPTDRYTHVRWTLRQSVGPGEEVRATFRARIIGTTAKDTSEG